VTDRDRSPIEPGAWLGMLGSGQLGRMFTLAAKAMGYRVLVLAQGVDDPAAQVADRSIAAGYDDLDAVAELSRAVEVVSVEFENIPSATLEAAARHAPTRPGPLALTVAQNRLREKEFLRRAGIPTTPFEAIDGLDSLARAVERIGAPAVLKTAAWGYDGKGQALIATAEATEAGWEAIGRQSAVLEGFVDFDCEISVMVARDPSGNVTTHGPMENAHANHILDVSLVPARVSEAAADEAIQIACSVAEELDYVGVLGVEFFVARDGRVLVNEIAPRTHNSGHLTIEGHVTSQFEQQVRAICGLPLGSVALRAPACAMANLLGELWQAGTPRWAAALEDPDAKLHLYGKAEARPGRKMGHLTVTGSSADAADEAVRRARARLTERGPEASAG
jgi:5-(carboxyamino)imidazole ribonucleotide synthase